MLYCILPILLFLCKLKRFIYSVWDPKRERERERERERCFFLLLITRNFVVSVRRGLLFPLVIRICCLISF